MSSLNLVLIISGICLIISGMLDMLINIFGPKDMKMPLGSSLPTLEITVGLCAIKLALL